MCLRKLSGTLEFQIAPAIAAPMALPMLDHKESTEIADDKFWCLTLA